MRKKLFDDESHVQESIIEDPICDSESVEESTPEETAFKRSVYELIDACRYPSRPNRNNLKKGDDKVDGKVLDQFIVQVKSIFGKIKQL